MLNILVDKHVKITVKCLQVNRLCLPGKPGNS